MNRCEGKGVALVVLSSVLFGMMPMLVKAVLVDGMTLNCSMAYRFFGMAAVSFLVLKRKKCSLKLNKCNIRDITVFGFFGFGLTNLLLGSSYLLIPMGLTTVCHFTYPVAVVLITRAFFKDQMNMEKRLAVLFTLVGLGILMRCNGNGGLKGMLIAAASGLTYGCYVISLDKSSLRELDESVIVFYVTAECSLFYLVFSILGGSFQTLSDGIQAVWIIGSAVMGMTATALLTKGVKVIGASRASFINMLEPLTNFFVDFLVYGTIPSILQWIGTLLMLSAVGIIALFGQEREKR